MILFRRQQGIAVITVLLALAIAVLVCSEVLSRVYASMKRSENQFNTQQAWEYALGGEVMARQMLAEDYENDKLSSAAVDHLHEKWAQSVPKISEPGGSIEFAVFDMQSRFNLNNLVNEEGEIQVSQVKILEQLMAYLGVRSNFADMAARWASYENDTGDVYGTDKLNYRAADTQFGSVSELRLLPDLKIDEYRRIAPYISALPIPVRININTAPEPVLLALTDGSEQSAAQIKNFVEQRSQMTTGYASTETIAGLLTQEGGGGVDGMGDSEENELSVNSEYFEVRSIGQYGNSTVWLISVLRRDAQTGEIVLLSRDTGQHFTIGLPEKQGDSMKENNSSSDLGASHADSSDGEQ